MLSRRELLKGGLLTVGALCVPIGAAPEWTEFVLTIPGGKRYGFRVPGFHEWIDVEWYAIRQHRATGRYFQKQVMVRGMGVFELEPLMEGA
ncbi:MAG: hypothetical protein IMZ50_17330 [Candidatus Atribacteria bacterium]|nr:hypothetical protein [Candidatus Atribacteria bacterium]